MSTSTLQVPEFFFIRQPLYLSRRKKVNLLVVIANQHVRIDGDERGIAGAQARPAWRTVAILRLADRVLLLTLVEW
jgi:hypothetical protein